MPQIDDVTTSIRVNIVMEVDDTVISVGDNFVVIANTKGTFRLAFEHPRLLQDFIRTLEGLYTTMMKEEP